MSTSEERPRMLTGDRPTGALHLGHYVGSLQNRARLQHTHDAFFIIADLHMLTTRATPEDIAQVDARARGLVLDAISSGIEPETATFYLQSAVPDVHELAGLLHSLITVTRLERLPALKDMARAADVEMSLALLAYPVLQSADILGVRAHAVPVGKDNYGFVEVTRELARRFNSRYETVFPIPDLITSETPTLIGTDGQRKMSKSLGNAVALSDDAATVRKTIMRMYTDPNRTSADVPGTVEGNPVFAWLDIFEPDAVLLQSMKQRYRQGTIGDVDVKARLADDVNSLLEPMRERRARYDQSGMVDSLLETGTQRTRLMVQETVMAMKRAMGLTGVWNRIHRRAERYEKGLKR